ncbi:MAG: DegV family protein [Lachnospiraceae bacterium]|nr:DegV family protein [Lachnospiraceae bacterium]
MKFVTDSSGDLYTCDGQKVENAPLRIYTDEREFLDTKDLDVHEMLDYLLNYHARSYTACPSTDQWLETFEGGDEIYVLSMTSRLSGTYNSACAARDIYLETHPDAKILVVDTLTTGPEMRLYLEKVIAWKKEGKTFEEISKDIEDYKKETRLFFTFQSLHNFAQNGRVNKVVASLIGKLDIRIVGTASPEGDIAPEHKCRGGNRSIKKVLEEMEHAGFHGGKLRICHVENEDLATDLGKMVLEKYPSTDLVIYPARALVSYYAERGGLVIGCECKILA